MRKSHKTGPGAMGLAISLLWLPAFFVIAQMVCPRAPAQTGGGYDLSWSSIAAGGGCGASASTGGKFAVVGTVGQAAAGPVSAGNVGLDSGFWTPIDIFTFELDYGAGWNFISVPIHPLTPEIETLFDDRTTVSIWEIEDHVLRQASTIAAGKAYWLHSDQVGQLVLKGTLPGEHTMMLHEGWNPLGRVCRPDYPKAEMPPVTDPPASVAEPVFGWDPEASQYVETAEVAAGEGAWIRAVREAAWSQP